MYTHARIENQEFVASKIDFFDGTSGLQKLMQNWPIVLAVMLAILLVSVTLIIMHKTGVLAKMNPYKLDEEEFNEERRKTQVRKSVRFSQVQTAEV